jgi:hypothetical protein
MDRGIVALVFLCKVTGGQLTTSSETDAFRWAAENEALPAPGSALRPARRARAVPIAALTNSHQRQAGTTVFLALDCPARGHHVQGGPAGRRTRSATPTLDPAATHLVLAPTRKAGTEQLIEDIQPTIS